MSPLLIGYARCSTDKQDLAAQMEILTTLGVAAGRQQKELRRMYDTGAYSIRDLEDVFSASRPTVYRTLAREPVP